MAVLVNANFSGTPAVLPDPVLVRPTRARLLRRHQGGILRMRCRVSGRSRTTPHFLSHGSDPPWHEADSVPCTGLCLSPYHRHLSDSPRNLADRCCVPRGAFASWWQVASRYCSPTSCASRGRPTRPSVWSARQSSSTVPGRFQPGAHECANRVCHQPERHRSTRQRLRKVPHRHLTATVQWLSQSAVEELCGVFHKKDWAEITLESFFGTTRAAHRLWRRAVKSTGVCQP